MSPLLAAAFAIALPLVAAPALLLPGPVARRAGPLALLPAVGSVLLLVFALAHGHEVRSGGFDYAPALGLECTLLLDRLSLLFALIVSGVGALIVVYALGYLHDAPEKHPRFFATLLFFMGTMLGTVLSGNLLMLFIFWEMTGIASFLLIGFSHEAWAGRRGARMALITTGGLGLCMMFGVVMLGEAFGTLDLAAILGGAAPLLRPAALALAAPFLLLGAFGKSAQFPFQYWLPNAMAAPTPVSAYLHSATMVKLGIFLVARLDPLFRADALWNGALIVVCFGTAALAALQSLLSHDLKAILAYSTVSQLALLLGGYGLGAPGYAELAFLHILAHVAYKGGLFMIAGIIDHGAGTRDLRRLAGLGGQRTLLFATAALLLGLAALPGSMAFLSKEALLEDLFAFHARAPLFAGYALVCLLFASALKVAIALRIHRHLFVRQRPDEPGHDPHHFHGPSNCLLAPALFLAAASALFGLLPAPLGLFFAAPLAGLPAAPPVKLALWHGFNLPLLFSLVSAALGVALYAAIARRGFARLSLPAWLQFDLAFDRLHDACVKRAALVNTLMRTERVTHHLPMILASVCLLLGLPLLRDGLPDGALLAALPPPELKSGLRFVLAFVVFACCALLLSSRQVVTRLIATGVAGMIVTMYYILFLAPDLAITQFLVETLALIAMLSLVSRVAVTEFPVSSLARGARARVNGAIAVATGLLVGMLTLAVQPPDRETHIGQWYLSHALDLAEGRNVVNTILVDFRGTDTLFEIVVLAVAALGCLGLMRATIRPGTAGEGGGEA